MNKYIAFCALFEDIVYQELDQTQQQQYAIEGEEIMSALFKKNELPLHTGDDLLFDFGFSPSEVDLRLTGITFIDVANALFYIHEGIADRGITGEQHDREASAVHYIKQVLVEKEIFPSLINLLVFKYQDQVLKIIS